jgi:hypothetical protein
MTLCMVITYQGDNYFKIQSGDLVVLIDPTNTRSFKGAGMILNTKKPSLITRPSSDNSELFWIDNEGKYEKDGIRVSGWTTEYNDGTLHTAYHFFMEGIRVAVLGHISCLPSPQIVENFQEEDILIIPGCGDPFIKQEDASKIVRQIEPGFVIPSLVSSEPKKFFDELNAKPIGENKITVKKKDISPGAMVVRYITI